MIETYILPLLEIVAHILLIVVPLLVAVAYLTYFERKVIGAMQLRKGPNRVGPFGLLQPLADGAKLFLKETIIPAGASPVVFLLAPMLTFTLALIAWAVIPIGVFGAVADINVGILYLFAIGSLEVYGIIMAGWASNSRYPFLGALRSAAQMVSYEVSLGFVVVCVILLAGTMNLTGVVQAQESLWFVVPLFPMFIVAFVSALAELNRAPFDLPEGEAELVGGYFTEYSSMSFALFFLGEYANMIMMSAVLTLFFLGGWYAPFGLDFGMPELAGIVWFALKIAFLLFCMVWVRATFPRFRYDQLMRLGWKIFLPFSMFYVVLVAAWVVYGGQL